jgi:hypothetical protein
MRYRVRVLDRRGRTVFVSRPLSRAAAREEAEVARSVGMRVVLLRAKPDPRRAATREERS